MANNSIIEGVVLLMINLTSYKLQLVKDTSARYDMPNKKISSPRDAYSIIKDVFSMEDQCEEVLVMLVLNTKNAVVGCMEVSRGTLNSSLVHPREIFKRALLLNGASIILGHNHPSGDSTPSKEDVDMTKRIKECGHLLGIELLDHIVTGDSNYTSLKDRGLM